MNNEFRVPEHINFESNLIENDIMYYPKNIKTFLLLILGETYVNVAPGQAPQDIYGEIATLVEEKRASDQSDDTAERHEIATILEGFVRRKVIKQTVMTTVYGVTEYGARLQIEKQ